jgi:hypothetical protein
MEFGNWIVKQNGISWNGQALQRFEIPAEKLNVIRQSNTDDNNLYEWILLATDEDWLTENDLVDLNFAFVYGAAKFGLDFNYEVFDATLDYQFELFEDEEREG